MAPGAAPTEGTQPYTKAERLLNLLMALLGTRTGLDREQIRATVRGYDPEASPAAFERMFERDKDELRAMGVPVTTLRDAAGVVTGYRVDGPWSLPALNLDSGELALLGLAVRLWQPGDLAPAAVNALRKVEALLGVRSDPGAAAPIAGMSTDSPVLPALISACTTRTPVTFEYQKSASAPVETRHVQPWGVVWWRAHWYLVGHDSDRGSTRVFRASRIVGAIRTEDPSGSFTVPEGFDAREAIGRFRAEERQPLQVALAPGSGAELRRVARALGAGAPGAAPEGWDLVEVDVEDLAAGVGAVLALGSRARVAGPDAAVAEACRQLEAIIAAQDGPPAAAGRPLPAPMAATGASPAGAQFSRLLALVPWLAANSGVSIAAAAAHFGISEEQLVADLGSVITSGADDWTLFDIQYWENGGIVEVIDPLQLGRPLALSPEEALALLVALQALAAVPGDHARAALDGLLAKVRSALGAAAPAPGAVTVRVDLPDALVETIQDATAARRALELTYLGAVRDEVTHRVVDPVGVVVVDGYAYLRAHCRSAAALRLFRLDRVLELRVSALPARPVADAPATVEPMAVALAATGRRVVVDVPVDSVVLDRHPSTRRWPLADGGTRVELPVGDYGWARRLVLGSAGSVVLREPAWLAEEVRDEAARCLAGHRR